MAQVVAIVGRLAPAGELILLGPLMGCSKITHSQAIRRISGLAMNWDEKTS
ncbi:MAG: hypothetical protein WBM08_07115 [Prochlorococcaceae cyanobacterium]